MSERAPNFEEPICPMTPLNVYRECIKERCAWWIKDYKSCAVKDLAMTMDQIRQDIQEIVRIKAGV